MERGRAYCHLYGRCRRTKEIFRIKAKALLDKGVRIEQVNGIKTLFTVSPASGAYKVNFGEEEFMNYFKEFCVHNWWKCYFKSLSGYE